ncbi:E3 ubiquitin-protein ligase CHFR isoform X1 [Capsicum galapagoense]
MEKGESSTAKLPQDEVWAKLIPTDSLYSEIELRLKETVICSEVKNSYSEKQEWCKITRNVDLDSAMMQNKSSKEILVDETVVQDEHAAVIKCGSEISLGPSDEGYVKYRFKIMSIEESRRYIQISLDVEYAKCCICLNIWHDVVTAAPCLHNFCNGCFSEWLRRSQERRSSVLCPHCRAVVHFVGRNHFLHNIEEDILLADPSLKRSSKDIVLLDSCASIKSPLEQVLSSRKSHRKRERSPADAADSWDHSCPQCDTEYGGYKCNENTVHLQCQACGGMMPFRLNVGVQQHCLGCDRAFCAAYWHSQGVNGSNLHPLCSPETFKPIAERAISRIPSLAHEKNHYEQNVTERCIRQMGKSLQDVVANWILKLDKREIDRTRMPLNHVEMITSRTPTCSECYDKLVSFLLYWFRITTIGHHLPSEDAQRQDCWYGYACRTQHHNQEHARKRNHVCRPTRGNHV